MVGIYRRGSVYYIQSVMGSRRKQTSLRTKDPVEAYRRAHLYRSGLWPETYCARGRGEGGREGGKEGGGEERGERESERELSAASVSPAPVSLFEAAERFERSRAHLSPHTRSAYRSFLRRLLRDLGPGSFVEDIRGYELEAMLLLGRESAATKRDYLQRARVFFRFCEERGYLRGRKNPVETLSLEDR